MDENTGPPRSYRSVLITMVVITIIYPLTIAPVQWAQSRDFIDGSDWRELRVYTPIVLVADHSPNFIKQTIDRYAWLFTPYRTRGGVI